MPHSMPVSKLMINRNEWPQLRADMDVRSAIKILRIVTEDKKLEHGHSTPLVLDDNYNLLGFVHLTALLKSVRHLCEKKDQPCELDKAVSPVIDLVTPFKGSVQEDDSILKALDIMLDNDVSLVPVLKDGKLQAVVKLSDIFNTVSALLFDEEDPEERHRLLRDYDS
jgi:CBS domain-containing protein